MNERRETFEQGKAIFIGRQARHEGACWESAVRDYCCKQCGGSEDDARVVIKALRQAVEQGWTIVEVLTAVVIVGILFALVAGIGHFVIKFW